MSEQGRQGFWREVFARQGSIIPQVLPLVLTFGVIATGVWMLVRLIEKSLNVWCALEIMPFEFAGAALGALLVFRTTAGYDRWWEARKLWGGFVDRTGRATVEKNGRACHAGVARVISRASQDAAALVADGMREPLQGRTRNLTQDWPTTCPGWSTSAARMT